MTVARGTRLGPYEISSPIGSGGMGEVYRARDTRLDRDVAIKVLPAEFAADAQFKLRLEREAKTISALNDPHICTLYDVGDNYLVMELLEGETLAERLVRGALPTDEVLRLGIQTANALDRAHKQGIVHRDLKPGNIMLTKSGVKLLDFGLAKSSAPLTDFSGSTQHKALTQEGTIVGTFQYMAPEQLEGAEADARTDIFALGALIYEMATAKRAFEGKTRTSLIAAIVSGQPTPVSQIQPLTPPALEHVIERCLEKDPADRWQSAHDVAEELKWISVKGSQAGIAAPIAARRKTRERLYWLIALAAVIAAAGFVELRREPPRIVQSSILPPEKAQFVFDQAGPPALSPDGKRIVYVAQPGGSGARVLYVRSLGALSAQPLAGTEDASFPFWSPDNQMIGFFAGGKLKKMDASGGPVQTVADATQGRGGTWSEAGVIVFAPASNGPLLKVSDDGGVTSPVTRIDATRGDSTHRLPFFLPDGRHFVYLAQRAAVALDQAGTLAVGSIDGDVAKALASASSNACYSPSGHLVYWRDRSLVAQKFDAKRLTVGRSLVPIAENIVRSNKADAAFSLSNDGTLVYQTGPGVANSQLRWVDIQGKALEPIGKPADYRGPSLSNDGRRVASGVVDPVTGRFDLWIIDLQRGGTPTRLTFDAADEFAPIWSPDDSLIGYSSDGKGSGDLMLKRSAGTGGEELLYANNRFKVPADWSPDGKTILFQEQNPTTGFDLALYSIDEHKARIFLQTPFNETGARFSPDGHWIAYQSDEAGKNQIYVLPVSGNRGKWQISTDGGTRLRWSRDGKQIYYLSPDYTLMAVDVAANGDQFTAAVPRALFPLNIKRANGPQYDITADGKRVLVNAPVEQAETAPLTLVQNWTAALKK